MTIAPKINEAPTCHLFFNPFQARLSTAENAQPKLSRVTGSAIMWACRSAYINVNNGNSVMGADSLGAGMMRVGFQYHSPVPYGSAFPLSDITIPRNVTPTSVRNHE